MTDNPCPLCDKPILDTAYVCHRCVQHLRADIEQAADWWDESEVTLTRQDRVTHGPSSGKPQADSDAVPHETPVPFSTAASETRWVAANTIGTWARHIAEERGVDLPAEPRTTHYPRLVAVPEPDPTERGLCAMSDLPRDWCDHCRADTA